MKNKRNEAMTHAIKIGKAIYAILAADTDVNSIVGSKIFPLVAENGTTFPFLCYTREGLQPSTGTKDGYIGDLVTFRVDVVADTYNQLIDLADAVRQCLEKRMHQAANLKLEDTYLASISEAYDSDTYITQMRFICVVNDDPSQNQTITIL